VNRKPLFLLVILFSALLSFVAPLASADTTVFAAASLKNALDEINQSWSAQKGSKVVVSYAASSALARQIEKGAPADMFISADLDWMDYLAQRKLVNDATRINLLRNELVMIAPASSKISVELKRGAPLGELLGNERLSMADPDSVPSGKYGKAALEALGLWSQVSAKIIRADNVRTALNFVARGETPLGIVYRTDASAEGKVRVVAVFPADTHPLIVYPAALLADSKNAEATAFFSYLKSNAATGIFRKHGFLTY
jgi:molybdate transport system substrate-binding protein